MLPRRQAVHRTYAERVFAGDFDVLFDQTRGEIRVTCAARRQSDQVSVLNPTPAGSVSLRHVTAGMGRSRSSRSPPSKELQGLSGSGDGFSPSLAIFKGQTREIAVRRSSPKLCRTGSPLSAPGPVKQRRAANAGIAAIKARTILMDPPMGADQCCAAPAPWLLPVYLVVLVPACG